jgi:very-short-patch-repair endonuclease
VTHVSADEFIENNRATLSQNHGWELRFVDQVLRHVRDLDFANVEAQTEFRDRDGTLRRIDFTVTTPGGVRIALEVDGWDQTGSGSGATARQFAAARRREQSMVSQGWRLMRFANRNVKDNPRECAANISDVLRFERELVARAKGAEEEVRAAQERAVAAEAQLAYLLASSTAPAYDDVEASRAIVIRERERFASAVHDAAITVLPANEADRIAQAERSRAAEVWNLDREFARVTDRIERDHRSIKRAIAALGAGLVAVAVLAVALQRGDDPSRITSAGAVGQGACADAIPWEEARSYVGQSATISGPVVSATYRELSSGKPTFLNIGAPFGDDSRFVVVIFGESRSKFPTAPESRYDGRQIAVTGTVDEYRGVPQVVVNTPSAIETC